MSGLHKDLGLGERHPTVKWEYADETARLAATGFTAAEVGGEAWQKSDDTFWALIDESPITWKFKGGGGVSSLDPLFQISAGRNSATVTNVYLRTLGQVPMNLASVVIPYNATIVAITVSTNGNASWTAEVRKNGSATVIASTTMTNQAKKNDVLGTPVNVNAADEIQIYCNGTNIPTPVVTVWLKRR